MNVMILLLFIGVFLVMFAVGFFVWNVRSGALQHADRLALLPLGGESSVRSIGTNPEMAGRELAAPEACSEGSR